jgi:hypothetical protein
LSPRLSSRTGSLVALGALVAVGFLGVKLWNVATSPSRAPEVPPDDDLDMFALLVDAAAPAEPERLAVASGRIVIAHGPAGEVGVLAAASAPTMPLGKVGAPVAGLAIAGDAAWVTSGRTVRKLPLDGGPPSIVADKLGRARAVAADGTSVVFVDLDTTTPGLLPASRVVRLTVGHSETTVLGTYKGEIIGVALDHGTAYWADRLDGSILAAGADATTPTVLAADRGLPGTVVVVGDTIVWDEKRTEALWAMPRGGGKPRQLLQDFAGFAHLVAHGTRVAWVNEAAVEGQFRVLESDVGQDGGGDEVIPVSPPVDSIDALACDGSRLYWVRDGVASLVDRGD